MARSSFSLALFIDGLSLPAKEGVSVHTYEMAKAMAKAGVPITLVIADRARASAADLRKERFSSILLPPDDYYDPAKVTKLIQDQAFDIVQNYNAYYIASILGPASVASGAALLTELHDVEADRAFLYSNAQEISFQNDMQTQAVAYSKLSRVISSYDFDILVHALPPMLAERLWYFPIGVGEVCARGAGGTVRQPYAAFVGNMAYPPNRQAAERIITRIAPALPDVTFRIIGRESKDLTALIKSSNVEIMGEVDDLVPVLRECKLGLAPIEQGSGMKVKLLLYLATGLPIVATELATRGFPQTDSVYCVSDHDQEFVDCIESALASEDAWQVASDNARAVYDHYFNLDNCIDEIVAMYQSIMDSAVIYPPPEPLPGPPDLKHFPWHNELRDSDSSIVSQALHIEGRR